MFSIWLGKDQCGWGTPIFLFGPRPWPGDPSPSQDVREILAIRGAGSRPGKRQSLGVAGRYYHCQGLHWNAQESAKGVHLQLQYLYALNHCLNETVLLFFFPIRRVMHQFW
ncbi:hypothetical protein L596_025812 [Steinernema carpocapsae]|uniref:Uncharacterized protein n=1 Tax=Steinernema carpocapsae TaxID=34508 RepID=A0A4U5M8W8_STECR|nr:hypothetical protein L596_025812 [Steinernema carpocapsae]